MRTIKFRVWDGERLLYTGKDDCYLAIFGGEGQIPWGLYDNKDERRIATGDPDAIFNNPSVIEQFTGLHDKNGTPVYEGDILSKDPFLKVVFENGGFCFSNDLSSGSDRLSQDRVGRLEVIGNIHSEL